MGLIMKLSDYIKGVGRPIAYYPGLRSITGSTTATIFLCQFVYWTGKESSGDGWIYKTSSDIESETGLSYDEQKTARSKLVKEGLIEERYARLEHQMYFKVNLDNLNEKWGNRETPDGEHGNVDMAKAESPFSLNSNTENTTENTSLESDSKEIFNTYQDNIGLLTPMLADKINDAIDTYPKQWVLDAIQAAVTHNARNWSYINAILKKWETGGRTDNKPIDKMNDFDREMLRRGLRPASEVIEEMGLNDKD